MEKSRKGSRRANLQFKTHPGPPISEEMSRVQFNPPRKSHLDVGLGLMLFYPTVYEWLWVPGPMWSVPIQTQSSSAKFSNTLKSLLEDMGTEARMEGMLIVAKEELDNPSCFTPSKIAGTLHCECPPLGASGMDISSLSMVQVTDSARCLSLLL